ncbi:HAD family hydrolase [Aliarcobacter skirrowii]|jgi:HAD superfamily hydrolase (TIGR01509 family)|uniref:phosphoglycolate phosphatase n=1 Tax=Aliarcobacter skirrowii CCUG 10374 TaxID=1032239 RepID=A0AAD0SL91_9BACT|nr:HAD-IA family hydrolase [Aliarcobacter skirrowii]AXX84817.1 beta-phosphoglucomutase-like HAD superfamily hydrolase [Aliarcobacter skirrowii CCUG 10374]KAB0620396.1 HAD-IA family hydrolase [Aliarcobacter skirrowii CCUG 10374]MDD2508841.1 HAD-IA family hydrolase [Aliarcobacter skirrowii]MDD3497519.1 HAD-IA family hydrolase [Aliarcobacter skirrowii]MDX4027614.1 HAD-IA family hydrolase [Aliarcobacter skirrowii]
MKKYILFDNDGVLVETEKWYFEANKKALKLLGLNLEMEFYQNIMVKGGSAFELALLHNIEHNIIEKHRSIRDSFYQEFITTKDISIQNVKDTLKELSKRYKMAIVTTSRRVDFELIHKNSGITNFMDFVLCVEDYKRAKPHPDPYLKGLEKFNSKDFEAIVVEDSQRGLESSKRANIDCIVVKNEFTQKQDFSKADYFINNIEELKKLL